MLLMRVSLHDNVSAKVMEGSTRPTGCRDFPGKLDGTGPVVSGCVLSCGRCAGYHFASAASLLTHATKEVTSKFFERLIYNYNHLTWPTRTLHILILAVLASVTVLLMKKRRDVF